MNITANWSYPTRVLFGPGRIKEIGAACAEAGITRPLLVTDRGLRDMAITQATLDLLEQAGLGRAVFAEVDPNLAVVPGGDNWAPVEDFTYFVEAEPFALPAQLSETPEEEVDATQACGYYTAELIDDGDVEIDDAPVSEFRGDEALDDEYLDDEAETIDGKITIEVVESDDTAR